jgi:hypothetical protein
MFGALGAELLLTGWRVAALVMFGALGATALFTGCLVTALVILGALGAGATAGFMVEALVMLYAGVLADAAFAVRLPLRAAACLARLVPADLPAFLTLDTVEVILFAADFAADEILDEREAIVVIVSLLRGVKCGRKES